MNPSPVNLIEAGSAIGVQFMLTQPIIDPAPDFNAPVDINFVVGDPSRVQLSSSTLAWTPSEWAQPKTLNITALDDGVHNATADVTVDGTVTAASPFYDGLIVSVTAHITDIDPAGDNDHGDNDHHRSDDDDHHRSNDDHDRDRNDDHGDGSAPTSTTSVPPSTVAPVTVDPNAATLPVTGASGGIGMAGGTLVATGAALVASARRSRRRTAKK